MQSSALQFLFCTAAAVIQGSMIRDWYIALWNNDFNIMFSFSFQEVDFYGNAKVLNCFIGDFFQEFGVIIYTQNLAFVINTYQQPSATCICESTDPFEVFVPPILLVFYVLILVHTP